MQVLHETQAKERSIEEELEKLLQQREQLEGMLLQLHSSTHEVQLDFAACCFNEVPDHASSQRLTEQSFQPFTWQGHRPSSAAAHQVACLPCHPSSWLTQDEVQHGRPAPLTAWLARFSCWPVSLLAPMFLVQVPQVARPA